MFSKFFTRTIRLTLLTLAVATTLGNVVEARGGGAGGGGGARAGGGTAAMGGGRGFALSSGAPPTANVGGGARIGGGRGLGRGGFRYGYNGFGYGYGYGYGGGIYGDDGDDYSYNPAPTGQALDAYNEKQDDRRAKLSPSATVKNYFPSKTR